MYKAIFAAMVAAGLIMAPLPVLTQTASAQATQAAAPEKKKEAKTKKPPSAGMLSARERQKKCGTE